MSDATQHTPGPWKSDGFCKVEAIIISSQWGEVAYAVNNGCLKQRDANAALIARAPTLLAQRDALAKQVSELRAALSRHGRHDNDCLLRHEANLPSDSRCTCGFSASLT